MGWAQRVKAGATIRAQREQRRELRKVRQQMFALKARIEIGAELTDAERQMLALAGPETLKWLGYERQVTLT